MKFVLAVLVLFAVSASATFSEQESEFLFTRWVQANKREYATADEFQYRYKVFKANLELIAAHNAKPNVSYRLEANQFADMTQQEFGARNGFRPSNRTRSPAPYSAANIPTSVDWRNKGIVTGIKNQGQCGSCWAFSAVASTEGAHAQATGNLVSLSEEELVDCGSSTGNQGCEGGLMDDAFQWIINNGGIASEASYPYIGTDGNACQSSTIPNVATISSYQDVAASDNNALLAASAARVVSVAIEADQACFQFYSSGVLSDPSCGTNLDHGVTLVGYNTKPSDGSMPYWIVKNSWGTSWGENGYVRIGIVTDQATQCGIGLSPSYPIV